MLAVGALLLTASGGYYAYAQFAKTGRDDLVHQVQRPTLPDGLSSVYVDAEIRPGVGQPPATDAASVNSNPEPRVAEETSVASESPTRTETIDPQTLVANTEKLTSSGQPESIQTPTEAPGEVPAYTVEEIDAWTPNTEQISMITVPEDGRIGAAIEELVLLQARRPGLPDAGPEEHATGEQIDIEKYEIEPTARNSSGIRIISPNSTRNPTTNEQMIAALLESNFKRATPTSPEPEFAIRMIVPGIGLRAAVEELEVVEEDDSRAWETPKHVVGHIPTTAKPGTSGQGWYFGHLESPISGEGNIFRRLPELAARFKRGEQFTIQLDAGADRYVYQVYRTDVVHASKFSVSDSGLNDITLVSCWPQYEYSERVLVTAALVNIVEIPESERIQSSTG